jgi:DNA (cytosine-5)-methyltransferase 1
MDLVKNKKIMINVGSDFSGVGAFNQALDSLNINYKTVFACDWDKYARETYIHNYGEPDYYPSDVYDRQIPKESLDIYMTSPPCQAFSLAGKRKGEKDKRGILFYNSHEFIVKNKPRYFIFENVKGLLSDDSGKTFNRWLDYLGGKSINGNPVIFPLEDAVPYHIYHKVLNAKNYGVPQNRERVFIVGIRDDSDNTFTWPKKQHLTKRLKDVLENDVDEKYYLSDFAIERLCNNDSGFSSKPKDEHDIASTVCASDYKIARGMNVLKVIKHERTNEAKIKRSKSLKESGKDIGSFAERQMIAVDQNYSDTILANANPKKEGLIMIGAIRGRNPENPLSREVGLPTKQRLELNLNGTSNALTTVQKDNVVVCEQRNDEGLRFFKDGVCGTIRTIADGGDKRVIRNQTIRRLTPRECFRLMDFADTFTWPVSNSQAYKQAGNSIVVAVLAGVISKLNL